LLQIDDWKKILKKSMSEKRYIHSCNVADTARELAKIHGYDENKAYLAGLLHDICKEYPKEKQLEFVNKSDLDVSS
jgi:nicotinate-nucleotide adenylyltransferase